jgi:hypothetical protein
LGLPETPGQQEGTPELLRSQGLQQSQGLPETPGLLCSQGLQHSQGLPETPGMLRSQVLLVSQGHLASLG